METLLGYLLFAAIPVVLYLFVGHPEPLWGSLVGGVALMLGHRFVARPYMVRVRAEKCLWCNRTAPRPEAEAVELEPVVAQACPEHRAPTERFFWWIDRVRWPLRLGIFVPLLVLLGTLTLAAAGVLDGGAGSRWVEGATGLFQLAVGLAVNLAAWGWLLLPDRSADGAEPIPVPFPVHNFFLLGVRTLLWIFRLVGVWWVIQGAVRLAGLA